MTDSATRLATIVIMNHNYGRYLRDAIESALTQTHTSVEVAVVDDASTDESAEVIRAYGELITPILLRENVGQTAALDAALRATRGDPLLTLDADDVLLPTAAATAVALTANPQVVKVHWPLIEVEEDLSPTGATRPEDPLPDGDLRDTVVEGGPDTYLTPPTSGNAWSRAYLERVLPGPAEQFRLGVDRYLFGMAPLFGVVRASGEPQALYRVHEGSSYTSRDFDHQLSISLRHHDVLVGEYLRWSNELGFPANPERWREHSWFHRLRRAVHELDAVVPPGTPFILIDEGQWNLQPSRSRQPRPFLEHDGLWWGRPPDGATAIAEVTRMREAGAAFAVFSWPAFWWLEHYRDFAAWLHTTFPVAIENDRLVAFDLRGSARKP